MSTRRMFPSSTASFLFGVIFTLVLVATVYIYSEYQASLMAQKVNETTNSPKKMNPPSVTVAGLNEATIRQMTTKGGFKGKKTKTHQPSDRTQLRQEWDYSVSDGMCDILEIVHESEYPSKYKIMLTGYCILEKTTREIGKTAWHRAELRLVKAKVRVVVTISDERFFAVRACAVEKVEPTDIGDFMDYNDYKEAIEGGISQYLAGRWASLSE